MNNHKNYFYIIVYFINNNIISIDNLFISVQKRDTKIAFDKQRIYPPTYCRRIMALNAISTPYNSRNKVDKEK